MPGSRYSTGVPRAVLAAGIILFAAAQAGALINPNFTPVHLTESSQQILFLEVGCPSAEGVLPLRVVSVVKGETPQELRIEVRDEWMAGELRDEIFDGEDDRLKAMVFFGRRDGDAGSGAITIDGNWFGLVPGGKTACWELVKDPADSKSVWDGSPEMLRRCVEYILADPDATVPVRAGVLWGAKVRIGQINGRVGGVTTVDLKGQNSLVLLVQSESGDRAFCRRDNSFDDITADIGLSSKSTVACLCDLTGDGLVDLVSVQDGRLSLYAQSGMGEFEAVSAEVGIGKPCLGLAPIASSDPSRVGVLASIAGMPLLVHLGENRAFAMHPLSPESFPDELGTVSACQVADFDDDGIVDVVQPFEEGGLFFKGLGRGSFANATTCGDVFAGQGRVHGATGDFDGDGLLDILFAGDGGLVKWRNAGNGQFVNAYKMGEPEYIAREHCSGGGACDINGDGRQDLFLLYERAAPHVYFSRGFDTFGFAGELDMAKGQLFPESVAGQQVGMVTDMNDDGAQDLVTVLADGSAWVLYRAPREEPELVARVSIGKVPCSSLVVKAWSADRCLGAWQVKLGVADASFASECAGPLLLKWKEPGGKENQAEVILESGPVRVRIGQGGTMEMDP